MRDSSLPSESIIRNRLFSGARESSFACNECKARKVKCDRVAPTCGHCQKSSRTCDYPEFIPKPGPKANADSPRRRLRESPGDSPDEPGARKRVNRRNGPAHGAELDHSISHLVHPVHDELYANQRNLTGPRAHGQALTEALAVLGLSAQHDLTSIVETYFEHMTAFSLFHRPTFYQKLHAVESPLQLQALLLALMTFTARFTPIPPTCALAADPDPQKVWESAVQTTRMAFDECSDECPPLHLLQALILLAWMIAYRGMRGRAWRLVGDCVRYAYEMSLHIEADPANSSSDWATMEERRRAWWVCWELDVFASTIKRMPTAINWASNTSHLPMADSDWFSNVPGASCPLPLDPSRRWKDLDASGNEAPVAWFLVLNSYKWDTYMLAVAPETLMNYDRVDRHNEDIDQFVQRRRETLANCLHCIEMARPEDLHANTRFLSFAGQHRVDDGWRYSNVLMTNVVRFMMCRTDIFPKSSAKTPQPGSGRRPAHSQKRRLAWDSLVAGTQEVASLLRNSSVDHIRLVNPCLSNAIWWQCCAIILCQVFDSERNDHEALRSNYDVMRTTLGKFVRTCKVPQSLLDSLDSMEEQLLQSKRTGNAAATQTKTLRPDASDVAASADLQVRPASVLSPTTVGTNESVASPSPFMRDMGPADFGSLPTKPFEPEPLDLFFDMNSWDLDSTLFRCPFE